MIKSRIQIIIMTMFVFIGLVSAEPEVEEIIMNMDELYRSSSSYVEMEMQISTPHWERTLSLEAWSMGMDKTFILINSPKKEKGMATLRIDNEMWNYLPKTDKVMKIPPSMMMSSWMGSDFTNDDLVSETSMLNDYSYKFITPDDARDGLIYVELIPDKDLAIVWGKIILAVRENDYLPVKQEFYDEKSKLMRIMNFKDIKEIGGKTLPTVLEVIPQNKEGSKTVIKYNKAQFDIKLDNAIFSLRNLKKGK